MVMKKRSEAVKEKTDLAAPDEQLDTFLHHKTYANHPRLSDDLEQIVTKVFRQDVLKAYDRLEQALKIEAADLSDRGVLMVHLNNAEENVREAHRLYMVAKLEKERFDADHAKVKGAMWTEATSFLQAEKDNGRRNKAITDADVSAKCAEMHPDEWRYASMRETQAKLVVSHMENLVDVWRSRCSSLRALLEARR